MMLISHKTSMPPLETQVASRKQRRKDDRRRKKGKRRNMSEWVESKKRIAPREGKNEPSSPVTKKAIGSSKKRRLDPQRQKKQFTSLYDTLDENTAAALRRDDEEIAQLERKLGGGTKKKSLNEEYAAEEGYGDDFGDFLNSLDHMVTKVVADQNYDPREGILNASIEEEEEEEGQLLEENSDSDEEDEEVVPMKPAASAEEPDEDSLDDYGSGTIEEKPVHDDHDESLTYKPVEGEDIYGRPKESKEVESTSKKYVPPHLRGRSNGREDHLRAIQRLLNIALNRLSEETLVSVIHALSGIYQSYPATDINKSLWKIVRNSCVTRGSQLMKGLIPLYVAAIRGMVIQGTSVDLGSFILESVVCELWTALETARSRSATEDNDEEVVKDSSNLVLICCYLYNFELIHCSLMYDLVRNFIEHFTEIDVENLLLILNHSGRTLRSDDPSALKEIVSLVQRKFRDNTNTKRARVEFMVSAILDLKNNKRRKQNETISDTTSKFRKMLGHIKANKKGVSRGADTSLRISLSDILNVETKGRWWKVGASWSGSCIESGKSDTEVLKTEARHSLQFDEKLLKLATKYRMNTDSRRAAFCIIMGAEDFEDCFEKLVRAGMLKNRMERDTVRVLLECCGNESSFNKFYPHLAVRLCEYQSQCKFSLQLSFFDLYKRFEDMSARKVANVAKLLFELVAVHNCLRFTAIKPIDIASPEKLSENGMIFVTIFLTNVLEYFEDPGDAKRFVQSIRNSNGKRKHPEDEEDELQLDDGQALQASLTVFLVQVMKSSPKYKKGSRFRNNLKAMVKACDPIDDIMD